MPSITTTNHPSGWVGVHYFVRGSAWSGCHALFLSVDVDGTQALPLKGAKFGKSEPTDACGACLSFMHGRKSVLREVGKGKVPAE